MSISWTFDEEEGRLGYKTEVMQFDFQSALSRLTDILCSRCDNSSSSRRRRRGNQIRLFACGGEPEEEPKGDQSLISVDTKKPFAETGACDLVREEI